MQCGTQVAIRRWLIRQFTDRHVQINPHSTSVEEPSLPVSSIHSVHVERYHPHTHLRWLVTYNTNLTSVRCGRREINDNAHPVVVHLFFRPKLSLFESRPSVQPCRCVCQGSPRPVGGSMVYCHGASLSKVASHIEVYLLNCLGPLLGGDPTLTISYSQRLERH